MAACDRHLTTCAECRAIVAELRQVIDSAQRDPVRMPASDLWPGIAARLATPADGRQDTTDADGGVPAVASHGNVVTFEQPRPRSRRQIVFTLPQFALAASLLIAVSAGVGYLATGRTATTPVAQEDAIQAYAEPLLPPSAAVERANFADAQYDQAVSDLEKILRDMRDELNPQTVRVIERNLAAIDQAIAEARAALDADPANTFLNSHLADARRKKLELLRRATMIYSTSGD
jgi:hypothetical protein